MAVEPSYIEALVASKRREDRTIEYKAALPGKDSKSIVEFLKDVSAMANASGGELIFGLEEDRADAGVPARIVGLPGVTLDAEILRLQGSLRDCLDPRLPDVRFEIIECSPAPVLLVRILPSWAAPHAVSGHGHFRFYLRHHGSADPMDVDQIRAAVLLSESAIEKARSVRTEAIGKLLNGKTSVPVPEAGVLVLLNLVPISAFSPRSRSSLSIQEMKFSDLQLLEGRGSWQRINFDGVLFSESGMGTSINYAQLFRSGAIEAATNLCSDIVRPREGRPLSFYPSQIEGNVIARTNEYLKKLKALGVQLPLFFSLTLLRTEGYSISFTGLHGEPIVDRSELHLPELLIDSFDIPADILLKDVFDVMWHSATVERSPNYEPDGRWKAPRRT